MIGCSNNLVKKIKKIKVQAEKKIIGEHMSDISLHTYRGSQH